MKIQITLNVPDDNNWHKVTRKIVRFNKKVRGKKGRKAKQYTFSVWLKSTQSCELYGAKIEQY